MVYTIKFHPAVRKDLKRIAPQAEQELKTKILPQLADNPSLGTRLIGQLHGYYKYRVSLFGVWYRIGYLVDQEFKEVVVLAVGPRGGFYQRLKQRLG